ncbi:hypothetical protein JOE23_003599, partial [Amphibacillus cookii]|nr:hypothetical protein [Amphibacillus cookii]
MLAKRDQVQLVQAYVSDKMWDDFIDTLKEAAPSYKALGVSIWEGVQTREDQMFDSVGGFANWLTYGIPKGILDANKANYEVMREKTNAYTVTNFLTLGTVDMVVGTFNPETPLSAEHLLDSFGVVSMVYGGAAAVKQVGGVATVKPITTLNTPIKPGPTGKQL